MSIPEQVITRGKESKHILKKAVRGLIPDEIIDRRKQGFGVPIYEWFFEQFGELAKRELSAFCEQTDFLDRGAVLGLLRSGRGRDAWFLLNFALWWKEFIDCKSPESAACVESGMVKSNA
jgi:asparagine synthase (glutamine-hydrolysing)